MPLVFAENEATESGISYRDRTGISYEYPKRYRRIIQPGERFVYYKGRKTRSGGRMPQVYFGTGVVGSVQTDPDRADRESCKILDYQAFAQPVPFRDGRGEYLETGAARRGYFQPGVRVISQEDFKRIIEAAQLVSVEQAEPEAASSSGEDKTTGPGYASPKTLRAIEDFAVAVALDEVKRRHSDSFVEPQPRNNPGFDILVGSRSHPERIYVEVKGTTRSFPQFFMTEGEIQFSRRHAEHFRLIVVYNIRLAARTWKVLWHEGQVTAEAGFRLSPVQWACEVEEAGPD